MESNKIPEHDAGGDKTGTGSSSNIWSIVTGVFTSPSRAFEDFNIKPRIIIPLVLLIIINIVFSGLTAKQSAKLQFDMMKTSTTIPPQVLDQMEANAANANSVTGGLSGAAMIVLGGVISALLAWGIGSFIFGGDSKFKKVWGVTILGSLIYGLGNLLKLPLIIAKESMYVSYGLAVLFPDKGFTSILYMFLTFFDVFMIWTIIVEGIGYAAVFGFSRGKGYGVSIIVNVILTFAIMGLMLIGMSFAGVEITFF